MYKIQRLSQKQKKRLDDLQDTEKKLQSLLFDCNSYLSRFSALILFSVVCVVCSAAFVGLSVLNTDYT